MSKRALIVDDSEAMRRILKDLLSANGFEVVAEAENGNAAVTKYQEFKPDVVLMDIVMPFKSGIEAVREIVALDPAAKIMICSALAQEVLVMQALDAGAKNFVVKPFDESEVLSVLENILTAD